MEFIIFTLFPEAFSYFDISLMARAKAKKFINIKIVNIRDFANDPHKTVDGRPYGGGLGMVLRPDIVDKALRKNHLLKGSKTARIILLTPQGKVFNQKLARGLGKFKRIALVCGRYEGFDERIRNLADLEISMGDFVLTGGEIPSMAVMDAVARLVPGVVGKPGSLTEESFSKGLLEYPQFTRPENFKGRRVPKVLLSGNHALIEKWRQSEALKRTARRRPDLLKD